MPDLAGLVALSLVGLCTIITASRWRAVAVILISAFGIRLMAVLFQSYIGGLPDSSGDAVAFEHTAWEWGRHGIKNAAQQFTGPHSYFHSWLISLLYALFGRSPVMAQSFSLWFGMGTVFLGWYLARSLWGDATARKAGWLLAFFPTLVLYSALIMREAFIWFFLLVALFGVARWARRGGLNGMALALFGFTGATFFHGAMVVGAIGFLGLVALKALRQSLAGLFRYRLNPTSMLVGLIAIGALGLYAMGFFSVPKLGSFEKATDFNWIAERIEQRTKGSGGEQGAAYPQWTVPSSPAELVYKAPARALYFAFSPFPWDVSSPRHLIGLLDGLLYVYLAYLMFRNRRVVWRDPALGAFTVILISYFLVFGLAIGNFGTSIRHRSKFLAVLVVLVAPRLPRLRLTLNRPRVSSANVNIPDIQ